MRLILAALALLAAAPARAAEWQIKPFLGVTFGGSNTIVDLDHAAGQADHAFGVSGLLLGDVFGVEADLGHTPGFFQHGPPSLVLDSGVTTFTGNLVVAVPRRIAEFTLRPYIVGGAGLMHVSIDGALSPLNVATSLQTMDLGGGVTGFLTRRIGVSWDVRYFRSIDKTFQNGLSFVGSEQLSFWRVNMALAIRL